MGAGFKGVDYYDVDALLSDEERMIQETVRRFVDERVMPIINEHHRAGTFPIQIVPQIGPKSAPPARLKADPGTNRIVARP